MRCRRALGAVLLVETVLAVACAGERGPPELTVNRTPLPGGGTRVHYPSLPASVTSVDADLRIGTIEGDPNLTFGDVRGIDADADGAIYVLDYLARDIRAFGPDGVWRRTLARGGEGPGEIARANGLLLVGDSLLWVQDHGTMNTLALRLDGTEVARVPMPVLAYGYVWEGTVDDAGRIWKPWHQSDRQPGSVPEDGLVEGTSRTWLVSFDPRTQQRDSVFIGSVAYRTQITNFGRSTRHVPIPFEPRQHVVVDPAGGFWVAGNTAYEIVRLDAGGDTTLSISADVPPPPVTEADREAFRELLSGSPGGLRGIDAALAVAPEVRQVIEGLAVDDEGRLWVRRAGDAERPERRYDVFGRNGSFVMSVLLTFPTSSYLPIRVRHGSLYALSTDELDVPYVVRARVPGSGVR